MQVGLLGDLDPSRIDDDQLAAGLAHAADDRRQVQVRPRHVVAPRHHQPRVRDLLGPDAGGGAERAQPRLGADAAAQWAPVEQRGAHAVEEAQVHRAAGQHAVRAAVVQRHHRLRAVLGDDRAHPRVDSVERLVPGDAHEAVLALGAHALERGADAPLAVDELRERLRHLGADHAFRVGVRARAADADDPRVLHGHREAAGVGAIERADTGMLGFHRARLCRAGWYGVKSAIGWRSDWLGNQAKTRPSHAAMSSTSASVTECGIGYSCQSTGWPSPLSTSRDWRARASGISGSWVPWAMKMGASRLVALSSAASRSASGRKHDSAMIPASRSGCRRPVWSAMAPPWEKPASTRRLAATPRAVSRAMSASIRCCDSRTPASSSRRTPTSSRTSYHARLTMPRLIVTGRMGACGNTKRTGVPRRPSAGTMSTKSWPSAPSPCIQLTARSGDGAVSISSVSSSASAMPGMLPQRRRLGPAEA